MIIIINVLICMLPPVITFICMRYAYRIFRKKEYAMLMELYTRINHCYGYSDSVVFIMAKGYLKMVEHNDSAMYVSDATNIYDSDTIRKPFIFSNVYKYYDVVYTRMKHTRPHKKYNSVSEFFEYVSNIIRKKRNRKEIAEMLE